MQTKEPQYSACLDVAEKHGIARLGLMTNQVWHDDPKRLLFILARYKFVARMLEGRPYVFEVGCGDAFGTRIVQQHVGHITALDFDPILIRDASSRMNGQQRLRFVTADLLDGPITRGSFDAAYALDVLEHIKPEDEDRFITNIIASLTPSGVLIFGMPSIESQVYASPQSKAGHVNCKSGDDFKATMERYFHTVFMFSMNDEVVHTGFYPMAHYLFAVCSHRK